MWFQQMQSVVKHRWRVLNDIELMLLPNNRCIGLHTMIQVNTLAILGLLCQVVTVASYDQASQRPLNGATPQLTVTSETPFDDGFAGFVDEALEYWHVPGIAIGVIDGNQTFTKVCNMLYLRLW